MTSTSTTYTPLTPPLYNRHLLGLGSYRYGLGLYGYGGLGAYGLGGYGAYGRLGGLYGNPYLGYNPYLVPKTTTTTTQVTGEEKESAPVTTTNLPYVPYVPSYVPTYVPPKTTYTSVYETLRKSTEALNNARKQ